MINQTLDIDFYKNQFRKNRYVKLPNFFTDIAFNRLLKEGISLLDSHSKRKNFVMEETNFTLRKISTVSGNAISETSILIPELYQNTELLRTLEKISDTTLFLTPDIADRHAIHRLHEKGDEHGGHVDTYPYVLITFLEHPAENEGGELLFVPNSLNIEDLKSDHVFKDTFKAGDCYFMNASANVHCVLPLQKNTNRTVLVFTYADVYSKDIEISYSSNKLYN